jgi:hypothetical protein
VATNKKCLKNKMKNDGTPTPNRKNKKLLPFPLSPKPKKGKNCIPSLHQCLLEIFIMGQYPFTYCAINRVEWAIP